MKKPLLIKRLINKKTVPPFLLGLITAGIVAGGIYMTLNTNTGLANRGGGLTIKWLPDTVTRWRDMIVKQGERYNVDPNFIAIIMTLESAGYSKANSGVAMGLMQVTPGTAAEIAQKHVLHEVDKYDIYDPATSIEFGAAYIAYLRDTFCGNDYAPRHDFCAELVAAGYNGGPGAANSLYKGEGLKSVETLSYSRDAMTMWRERNAATSPAFTRWAERGGADMIDKAATDKK